MQRVLDIRLVDLLYLLVENLLDLIDEILFVDRNSSHQLPDQVDNIGEGQTLALYYLLHILYIEIL